MSQLTGITQQFLEADLGMLVRPFKRRRWVKDDSQRGRMGQRKPISCGYLSLKMGPCREAKGVAQQVSPSD